MIKADHISMRFNLGIEKGRSLKELLIKIAKGEQTKKVDFWALTDISFNLGKGEVLGLVGSNGAGKSTLLKVIAGVMKPTTGAVTVNGVVSPMIELGAGFDFELTARENIILNGAVLGYTKKFIQDKFDEIVDFSELHEFIDVPVRNFSSGMVARLAFSVSTIVNPEILIVDEILSVGDIGFQKKCEDKMMTMINSGTTVLFVSHSIESIKKICSRAIWLDHGHLIMDSNSNDVCKEYIKTFEK